jgi:thioredoxin 1
LLSKWHKNQLGPVIEQVEKTKKKVLIHINTNKMAVEITDANFNELVQNSDKPVLIDFWAEWCGPCRMVAPIVEEMAAEYEGKAVIGKVNVDENPDVSAKFGIRNIPTVLFIKGGQVVDKSVGAVPKNILTEKMNAIL